VTTLDGTWDVRRVSGLLPPLWGVRKRIHGTSGETVVGPLPGVSFDVVANELRYRGPLRSVVDVLEPDGESWHGRTIVGGHEVGRFRLERAA
jgi:hypothetical protein